ncbi:MAG: multiheme c-type cytochrome [Shimia sp.]|uniref:multiheme c-type cytochrome n=1 Tax=Shimia sp. TaxID=1954381 RepID=UPI004059B0B8
MRRRTIHFAILLLRSALVFLFCSPLIATDALAQSQSSQAAAVPAYVGSAACADCHTEATEAWQGSHHAEAWRLPNDAVLDGAFQGEAFEHKGVSTIFATVDGTRTVQVTETDGSTISYVLHSVGGTHPLQHLILETETGRLQSFDVVWDVDNRRWFHLYPDQDLPPQDAFHWSGAYKNWNARCAECHATGFEKNYDFRTRSYRSTQTEIGVGCEACHGPGQAHLSIVNGSPVGDWAIELGDWGFSARMGDPAAAMEQCAGCHARREAFGNGNPLPGTAFADAYNLAMLRPELYHADGQILDEVYVYGSFLLSKMHKNGVTCANCHEPHSAELVAQGNAVCTQCHSPAGNPDFDSLPLADYDTPAHTHHEAGSDGAQCVNCHMADQVYMGNDWRRDHSFRVPRPDLTGKIATPNACAACHADQGALWAANTIAEWYPNGQWNEPHFGETLARARLDPAGHSQELLALAKDASQPDLVRATALWVLGPGAAALDVKDIGDFLDNNDPQIRVGALNALRQRAPLASAPYLLQGLQDDTRAVRIAAARAILGQPPNRLSETLRPQVQQAYREFGDVIRNQLDFAEAHLQIAGYAMIVGNIPSAITALSEAVRINPQNPQAWHALVRMTAEQEGRASAQALVRQALDLNPGDIALIELAERLK